MDVLVVCHANLVRSPLAAAMLLDARLPDVRVGSVGVRARTGQPVPDHTQRLAKEHGLDLSAHRSLLIEPRWVEMAGLVLTMSERIRDAVMPMTPGAAEKVFTLPELVRLTEHLEPGGVGQPDSAARRLGWLRDEAHLRRPTSHRPEASEDVADPIREPWGPHWLRLGEALEAQIGRLVSLARTS